MKRVHLVAALLFAALVPTQGLAQFVKSPAPTEWEVEVKMDDRSFDGVLALVALVVDGDLGHYAIKPEKIQEIRFAEPKDNPIIVGPGGVPFLGTIVTTSGEEITGTIQLPAGGIETELGTLIPNPRKMKSITFKGKKAE